MGIIPPGYMFQGAARCVHAKSAKLILYGHVRYGTLHEGQPPGFAALFPRHWQPASAAARSVWRLSTQGRDAGQEALCPEPWPVPARTRRTQPACPHVMVTGCCRRGCHLTSRSSRGVRGTRNTVAPDPPMKESLVPGGPSRRKSGPANMFWSLHLCRRASGDILVEANAVLSVGLIMGATIKSAGKILKN